MFKKNTLTNQKKITYAYTSITCIFNIVYIYLKIFYDNKTKSKYVAKLLFWRVCVCPPIYKTKTMIKYIICPKACSRVVLSAAVFLL